MLKRWRQTKNSTWATIGYPLRTASASCLVINLSFFNPVFIRRISAMGPKILSAIFLRTTSSGAAPPISDTGEMSESGSRCGWSSWLGRGSWSVLRKIFSDRVCGSGSWMLRNVRISVATRSTKKQKNKAFHDKPGNSKPRFFPWYPVGLRFDPTI